MYNYDAEEHSNEYVTLYWANKSTMCTKKSLQDISC